ncbi:LacI family DNA-binding transcriptional regulator [Alkalibacterium sp. 20]|uniref:LacI family DNA-binding transcriptional regulator n=1 Tax=Alkalibacterium sp. 20 TaxID=1798803 RepID=UPI0008FFE3F0|nr:LacI family DNA-binding transcriptional regulator [Alkalibacterium sp. 20]OJF90301.1 LacI family transcriptional regulator [Alkalibacterium sp. 20]
MATLNDVAKRANVSKMTVSRVINHPEQVTDELKELVYEAMRELSYRPNAAAIALANNRTQIIKLLILEEMDTTEPYYMFLLTGIANELDKYAYSLQLLTHNNIQIGDSDGFIVCGTRKEDEDFIHGLDKPTVLFGQNDMGVDYIDSDNEESMARATEYAIEKGYETVVYIGIDVDEPFAHSREKGYTSVMRNHGKETHIYNLENRSRYSAAFIRENWDAFPKNTLFLCASDRLGLGVIREIKEHGGDIPNDYGIIGHDGVFLDQIAYPNLTTLKQSITEMGAACARMVLKKVKEEGKSQGNQLFETELKLGGTTR